MQCAILVGGLATRMRPMTDAVPKAMLDVAGRPFLEYSLALLKKNGVDDAVLCVGHLADPIQRHFGDGARFGLRLRYSDDGPAPMGTAGALKTAAPLLQDRFFVLDGDAYLPFDYRDVMAAFERSGREALMVVFENHDRYDKSNAAVDGDRVTAYDRSGRTTGLVHVHAGLSVLSRSVVERLPAGRPSAQDEMWADLIARGELAAYVAPRRFYEVGSPSGLEEFRRFIGGTPCS